MSVDISRSGNQIKIKSGDNESVSYIGVPCKRIWNGSTLTLVFYFPDGNREQWVVPLTDLRVSGGGSAPANVTAANTDMDTVFSLGGGSPIKTSSDHTLTGSTTALQDVPELTIQVVANKKYHLKVVLKVSTSTGTSGQGGAIIAPTGTKLEGFYLVNTTSQTATQARRISGTSSFSTGIPAGAYTGDTASLIFDAEVEVGSTGGTLKIQTSAVLGTDVNVVKAGSTLRLRES